MHYKSVRALLFCGFLGLIAVLMAACGLQTTGETGAALLSATAQMPFVNTSQSCPAQGQGRAAVMPAFPHPQHQSVVYLRHQNAAEILSSYDPLTGNKRDLLTIPDDIYNVEAHVSPDGHWVTIVRTAPQGQHPAIQLIRVDGKYIQTLYCSPTAEGLSGALLSPDQRYLVFNEGKGQSMPGDALKLLDMKTGKVQTILSSLQPGYPGMASSQQASVKSSAPVSYHLLQGGMRYASLSMPHPGQPPVTEYIPLKWASNSSVYMLGMPVIPGSGAVPHQLYQLLDIKKPVTQQSTDVKSITAPLKQDGCQSYDITPDHQKLICSAYPMFGGDPTLPGVNVEPISGGSLQSIFTAPTGSQVYARAPRAQTILFIVNTIPTHVARLYSINANGTGLKLLASANASEYYYASYGNLTDLNSYLPWTNVSHDGKHYAILEGSGSGATLTSTLIIGNVNGGAPTTVSTIHSGSIVGWTAA
ncbi:hypothetical protein [Dictyobacter aurantiacus]|uniref:Lipoprotein LpqB beta-propeller domain-containing protein n=1 Tax=Dictyobacter aurantiacus TaxID=1936993 RepID=A0A401ZES5_9CHLR|nr:hypothetical protein [Dictyobacter aurantiacus]GCE05380.1 hypothetical protein KDAU_27090 [Dictyobacter aurantiacus]